MRFLSLSVGPFLSFKDPVTLPLSDLGLVVVEGRNWDVADDADASKASNGSGKSSLFEAIPWCLWGKMPRYRDRRLGDDEVSVGGRPANVSVTFETEAGTFCVTRARWPGKRAQTELSITVKNGNNWEPLQGVARDKIKASGDDLTNLLGFDYPTFSSALFLQASAMTLATSSFGDQTHLLESVLRFDLLTQAGSISKERQREREGQLSRLRAELESAQSQEGSVQEMLSFLQGTADKHKSKKVQLLGKKEEISKALRGLSGVESKLKEAEGKLKDVYAKISQLRERARAARERMKKFSLIEDVCPTCEQKVPPLVVQRTLKETEKESVSIESDLAALEKERGLWESRTQSLHLDARERYQLESELTVIEETLAAEEKQLEEHKETVQEYKDKKKKLVGVIKALEAQVSQVEQDAKIYRIWTKGFGGDGLKGEILSAATPVLNHAAEQYSWLLSDGAVSVELNPLRTSRTEDLLRIKDASGAYRPYESFSSGEKRRIDLIASLSLRALARWRLSDPVNLGLYDEVFDALDEQGFSRVASVIQQDMQEQDTVFAVTHNPALRSFFQGAKVLRVEKRRGESRAFFA